MKIAVAIDDWKLPIFSKNLKKEGYTFKKSAGLTTDTLFLKITISDATSITNLQDLITKCQEECRKSRLH